MTSRDFAYWLQGFFEISGSNVVDVGQVEMIKNHLNLVFKHEIDPSLNAGKTGEEIKELHDIHDGKLEKPTPPPSRYLKEGDEPPKPKKDKPADWGWLTGNAKPSKSNGGWSSGSSDSTLYRC